MATTTPPAAMIPAPQNPANGPEKIERKRIPMSVPQRKLQTPEIPGYRLYWFLDRNVLQAQRAGYEFVDEQEVDLNQTNVGSSKDLTGNNDLGSRVKILNGVSAGNSPEYLNLMKIKYEWFQEDQKALAQVNGNVLSSIFRDEKIMTGDGDPTQQEDKANRYVKQAVLSRPRRK